MWQGANMSCYHCAMRTFRLLCCAGLALASAACRQQGQDAPAANETANAVSPVDGLAVADTPLDRAALLMAAARAASAAALGQPDADQRRLLDGKRFEVRIRFGCPTGPQPTASDATFAVKFDEVDRMLRVRAAPDLRIGDPRIAAIGGDTVEAVEGFWLHRPWLLAEGCPPAPSPAPSPAASPTTDTEAGVEVAAAISPGQEPKVPSPPSPPNETVGIAEFFTMAHSRTARRDGRAYEAVKELGGVQRPSQIGYNLVLSGRLRQLPLGQVIACVAAGPDAPPDCVISAQFDRVRIESPGSREILAEWSR